MENIYNARGECVEIANLIDAIADGYGSLDQKAQDKLKDKLITALEAILDQLKKTTPAAQGPVKDQ